MTTVVVALEPLRKDVRIGRANDATILQCLRHFRASAQAAAQSRRHQDRIVATARERLRLAERDFDQIHALEPGFGDRALAARERELRDAKRALDNAQSVARGYSFRPIDGIPVDVNDEPLLLTTADCLANITAGRPRDEERRLSQRVVSVRRTDANRLIGILYSGAEIELMANAAGVTIGGEEITEFTDGSANESSFT